MDNNEFRELEKRRQSFDQKRNAFLDRLETLSQEQLSQKPGPDRWSLLQVAQHLMLGEFEVLQQLPERSALVEQNRSIRDSIMSFVVLTILRCGIRVKVPSPAMEPNGDTTLKDIRNQWDNSQAWLKEFVTSLDNQTLDRPVFSHPVSGPLTISQVVTLADVHFDSHMKKIEDRFQ